MSFTANWFQPDQTELEFIQVETRSAWAGHATIYPVPDKTQVQLEIPIRDAEKLHWEVRAYYDSNLNRGVLVASGDAFGGLQEPPPSNLQVVLGMVGGVNPNAKTCGLFLSGILPQAARDTPPCTGFYILNTTGVVGEFYLMTNKFPYAGDPSLGWFEFNASIGEDGTCYASMSHSVYGTIGGNSGTVFNPITIDASSNYMAGFATVQL